MKVHAPGPWHVHKTRTHFHIRSQAQEVAMVRNVTDGSPGWSSEADAALIGQSPSLLALVEEAIALAPIAGNEWSLRARAVVEKARLL